MLLAELDTAGIANIITQLITLVTTFGAVITSLIVLWRQGNAKIQMDANTKQLTTNSTELKKVATQVETVEKATNSMKDALVKATELEALQRGHTQGVADQKTVQADAIIEAKQQHPTEPQELTIKQVNVEEMHVKPKIPEQPETLVIKQVDVEEMHVKPKATGSKQ